MHISSNAQFDNNDGPDSTKKQTRCNPSGSLPNGIASEAEKGAPGAVEDPGSSGVVVVEYCQKRVHFSTPKMRVEKSLNVEGATGANCSTNMK